MSNEMSALRLTDAGLHLALLRVANSVTTQDLTTSEGAVRSCLRDCADQIHKDNRQRGWWNDIYSGKPLERNVGELLMLMVSEIAEIPSERTSITFDDKLPERLMIEVELADCAIRIFDTAGAMAESFTEGFIDGCRIAILPGFESDYWMVIIRHLANAMEAHRKNWMIKPWHGSEIPGLSYYLGRALHAVFYAGKNYGFNVADAMVEKLAYNKLRDDHSVENRKASGGKAY